MLSLLECDSMQFGSLVQMFQSKTATCVFEKFVPFYCATWCYIPIPTAVWNVTLCHLCCMGVKHGLLRDGGL